MKPAIQVTLRGGLTAWIEAISTPPPPEPPLTFRWMGHIVFHGSRTDGIEAWTNEGRYTEDGKDHAFDIVEGLDRAQAAFQKP